MRAGVNAWQLLLGIAGGLALAWLGLVLTLYVMGRRRNDPARLSEAMRLGPDVLRLLRRLATDSSVPRSVRWRLAVVVLYLAMPIDLIPDFIPIVGYADDAIVVALGLRWVIRSAGVEALERQWAGSAEGLQVVKRLAGVAGGSPE